MTHAENLSFGYGQNAAFWTYKQARSLDGNSKIQDKPIIELATDAVITALRQDWENDGLDPNRIDLNLAVHGLIKALEDEILS